MAGGYHPRDVEPLLLLVLGLALVVAGALFMGSIGPGQRVGRLLASTPRVSVEQALGLATDAVPRYVRLDGRLDSDEDFPDEREQPLIFRRRRLEAWRGRRWEILGEAEHEQEEGLHVPGMIPAGHGKARRNLPGAWVLMSSRPLALARPLQASRTIGAGAGPVNGGCPPN